MRYIIAGGRTFKGWTLLCNSMNDAIAKHGKPTLILSGTAQGADRLGEAWAKPQGVPVERYPADWDKYGRSAGYRRNAQMAENADVLVAFWDRASAGTKHMIDIATKQGLKVEVYHYEGDGL